MVIKSRTNAIDLIYIISAALTLRILPVLLGSPAASDIMYFIAQAIPILSNQNIYKVAHGVFPYSPLTMFIPAFCLSLANKLNIPFYIVMKMPALIGDISLSIAIYYWVMRYKNDRGIAFKAAMLYAVNPLAILISAFQGNMMSLPTLFMFLAVMIIIYDREKNYRLSALLLGLAVAFRGYPILLLPLILLKAEMSSFKKLKYAAYTIIPALLLFIPFLYMDHRSVIREVFGYSGDNEYGFAAIERAASLYFYAVSHHLVSVNNTIEQHLRSLVELLGGISPNVVIIKLLAYSKIIFLSVYLMVLLQYKKFSLLKLIVLTYVGFYFFYGGAASQYFIWILPFLYFLDDRFSDLYIILGTYAVISVYLCYKPFTLFGRFSVYPYPAMANILLNEFIALFSFWSLCGAWFFTMLFTGRKARGVEDDI